jgi:ribosomal protein S18 acetylase RimI-like enzyme
VRVRDAEPADAAALAELAERTFRDAFAAQNDPTDMDLHCATSFGPDIQAAEIADPALRTLVVEEGGALIAFAQVHLRAPVPPSVRFPSAVELRRIYVDARWHGQGVAPQLMARVEEIARASGAAALWLGVWEHNPRAIRFYQRCGFTAVGDHTFVVGSDPQRDLVMARELAPG